MSQILINHPAALRKYIVMAVVICLCSVAPKAQEFTFGTIPDTQNMSENDSLASKITAITQWYVDHKDSLNIKFVASLGDMTQWGAADQWKRVRKSYDVFKNAAMPYAPCQGNHEPDLKVFDSFFPVSEFQSTSTFGGYLEGMHNAYYLFSEAGTKYIVVVLQTHDNHIGSYDLKSIVWANDILSKYATRRAILVTHDFFENKALITDVIKKHDNLFLAVCGHSCAREKYWTELSPAGNKIHCIMTDYQCDSDKGATIRYYTFKLNENKIYAHTYNITKQEYENDENSQFCFKAQITTPEEPIIANIINLPAMPQASDSVKISANITDNNSITSATLNWRILPNYALNLIPMTFVGNEYSAKIPPNPSGSTICYTIVACNKDRLITNSLEYNYSIEAPKEVDNTSSTNRQNAFLMQSILWYQKSGEMQALYYQAYNYAKISLDQTLKLTDNTKKKALVVDVDETLLNNSPLFGRCIKNDSICDGNQWNNWVNRAMADTLPGALEFLNYASSKGVEVFYISNRSESEIPATLVNLKKYKFPNSDEQHMSFRPLDESGSKEKRRNKVAANYNIVMLCGDNLGDFSFVFEKREFQSITDSVTKYKKEFGKRFIVLPNPFYGSWEKTIYDKKGISELQRDSIRYDKVIGY